MTSSDRTSGLGDDLSDPRETADPFGRLVDNFARPIRDEVAVHHDSGPEDVRFHRLLKELVEDCRSTLTRHVARRAAVEFEGEVVAWLGRQREADAARSAEMTDLVARMGVALKQARGDDSEFYDEIDEDLARLRGAADTRAVRSVSQHLRTVIEEMARRIHVQREASEARVLELTGMVEGLSAELAAVKHQVSEDPLTGLLNRGGFDQRLAAALESARGRRRDQEFSLVLMDLDHFKSINDTHGHVAGDRVLKVAADTVGRHVVGREDVAARYGGEEFALILHHCAAHEATRLAEEIRSALEQKFIPVRGEMIIQTASFGVAQGSAQDTADSLIHRADRCLYAAKAGGRNRVVCSGYGPLGRSIAPPAGRPREQLDEDDLPSDAANESGRGWFTALRTRRSGRR